ncbi:DUF5995 family protein [Nakamurella sp.]|uniref:DUF5995 family protein n=1 Tax=Nakamurella sp. TaxID=1869182 RepID=UPI003783F912
MTFEPPVAGPPTGPTTRPIAVVLDRMQQVLDAIPAERAQRRFFAGTYLRTTRAVGDAVDQARFEDPDWVERWDAAFADLYLDAATAEATAPRPWRLAFAAPAGLPQLRHVLLGINAHINYDLPQALLAVISDADFADPVLMARRHRDHERIDGILSARVGQEDSEFVDWTWLDRLILPLNHRASRRFLAESRRKVWHNTEQLQLARLAGPDAYRRRLAELEVLSAAKIADLLAPGQVLLRLAVSGFGVSLPPE